MIPFLLRLTLRLNLVFTVSLLLIRAQSYDDSALTTFLTPPDGCSTPCFMGIQPGLTALREGATLLQTQASIESLHSQSPQFYDVRFRDGFAPFQQVKIYLAVSSYLRIERINLYDGGLPLSRAFLVFGRPAIVQIFNTFRRNVVAYSMYYPEYGLFVVIDLPLCEIRQTFLWDDRQDVTLTIGRLQDITQQPDYYLYMTELNPNAWAKDLRDMKRDRCR